MSHWGNASPEQLEAYNAVVHAFVAGRGPVPRADIGQSLDGRESGGLLDRSLKTLLAEGRIRVAKAELAKSIDGPWNPKKIVQYTASIYSVVDDDQ